MLENDKFYPSASVILNELGEYKTLRSHDTPTNSISKMRVECLGMPATLMAP